MIKLLLVIAIQFLFQKCFGNHFSISFKSENSKGREFIYI